MMQKELKSDREIKESVKIDTQTSKKDFEKLKMKM